MAPLPHADRAIIDIRKVRDYALNPDHPDGRHKARVFAAVLGCTRADHMWLIEEIRRGILRCEAEPHGVVRSGALFRVDIPIAGAEGAGVVRTGWIVREGEDAPRLVTLYVV